LRYIEALERQTDRQTDESQRRFVPVDRAREGITSVRICVQVHNDVRDDAWYVDWRSTRPADIARRTRPTTTQTRLRRAKLVDNIIILRHVLLLVVNYGSADINGSTAVPRGRKVTIEH